MQGSLLVEWGREVRDTVEWHLTAGQGLKLAYKAKILISIKTLITPEESSVLKVYLSVSPT